MPEYECCQNIGSATRDPSLEWSEKRRSAEQAMLFMAEVMNHGTYEDFPHFSNREVEFLRNQLVATLERLQHLWNGGE